MFKKLKRQNRDKEFEWTKNDDKVLQAIEAGDIEKLQMTLAKKGTSPTKLDTEGKTALHFAAQKGQYPCLEVLLQLGANPRASDGQGCTALHSASRGGHLNSMHRLIKAGVPINAQDFSGKTALHCSACSGHIEGTILLLQCGASVDIADEYGKTPLVLAVQADHMSVCKDLIDRGAGVNVQDHLQKTPLMIACESGHKDIVDLLIKRGARADLCDAQGYDAKYFAEGSKQENLLALLETAPSVATWDIRNEAEEIDDEVTPDAVDYIDTFDAHVDRSESPPPIKNQQNISSDFSVAPGRAVSMPALSSNKGDDLKELEEENDFLNEELTKVNLAHKKALERIRSLEEKASEHEVNALKEKFKREEEKRIATEEKINDLRAKLASFQLQEKKNSLEEDDSKEEDETNSLGSWGDSEDDLFDLPGAKKNPPKPVKPSMSITSSRDKADIDQVKMEVKTLRRENEDLKSQLKSGEKVPPGTVSRAEFERLRLSSNSKIADLEEELASLKEELEEKDQVNMVSYQEHQELTEVNNVELSSMKQENILLKEEIANISQRLAEMTDRKERLQLQVMEQQELQMRPVSSSSADFRYTELVQANQEMEEIINKHSEVLAEQADEIETFKRNVAMLQEEKDTLARQLANMQKEADEIETFKINVAMLQKEKDTLARQLANMQKEAQDIQNQKIEFDAIRSENGKLQGMIGKQSKTIAQQTERIRKDKSKMSELTAENDRLTKKIENFQHNILYSEGKAEERQELKKKNHALMEQVGILERQLEDTKDEKQWIEKLTAENWRLKDAVRKTDAEIAIKDSQLADMHDTQRLKEGNAKFQCENREFEAVLAERNDGKSGYSELPTENVALKTQLEEVESSFESIQNQGITGKKFPDITAENKDKMLMGKNSSLLNGTEDGGGEKGKATAALKEVERLKQQLVETDEKHKETVNIYRAHLLSAVQNEISPEVKEALQQIVKLRNGTQVT
ncbi:uncharacterized protein [Diadema antillarum]|uniref:uncharacterized protein isoform X2 n=1 Tax=Diadema antillarum TaxID=105358 RepID=UPI003A890792